MLNYEWNCEIPNLVPIRQIYAGEIVNNPGEMAFSAVVNKFNELKKNLKSAKVALSIGSRGICQIDEIMVGIVKGIRSLGGNPVIVPAMGSHGGDDPQAKAEILGKLGINESTVGAPVTREMETILIGYASESLPVYCNKEACSADIVILINRIKPHTDFRGKIESGLVKLAGVGLGGSKGAAVIHSQGYDALGERVRAAGITAISLLPVYMGVAIIETPNGKIAHIEAIFCNEIPDREEILLKEARKLVAKLPIKQLDVLVVSEMGKNISGAGLEPIVTGRYPSGKVFSGDDVPNYYRIAVLDLTEASIGNSLGIGLCDITTQRVYDKTDFKLLYKNVITGKGSLTAHLPIIMKSDYEAICVALLTCLKNPIDARMAFIKNTMQLENFFVTENLAETCVSKGAKVAGGKVSLNFDSNGSLILPEIYCRGVSRN
jgi:hypothetical protein